MILFPFNAVSDPKEGDPNNSSLARIYLVKKAEKSCTILRSPFLVCVPSIPIAVPVPEPI